MRPIVTSARPRTDGIELINTTAATSTVFSNIRRAFIRQGQGWKTTATAASQSVDLIEEVKTVQGAAAPTGNLRPGAARSRDGGYSPRMTLTSGGNLGIGTTSPGFLVDIWNTPSPATTTVFEVADAAAGAFENSAQFIAPNMITGSENIISVGKSAATNNGPPLGFFMQVITAPATASIYFFLAVHLPCPLWLAAMSGSEIQRRPILLHVGSASASGAVAAFQNSADLCTLTPGFATWSCSSDVRLKTHIADTGDALALLDGMRVRDFTMKATGERQTGVIAQELVDRASRHGPHGEQRLSSPVDFPNPWMLVKAIQELKADNDNLRAANDNLSARRRARKSKPSPSASTR